MIHATWRDRVARDSVRRRTGQIRNRSIGSPALDHISTSRVARRSHSLRQDARRYQRLTLRFSKSIEMHSTLGETPAMSAGATDRLWEAEDLVDRLIDEERRGEEQERRRRD